MLKAIRETKNPVKGSEHHPGLQFGMSANLKRSINNAFILKIILHKQ